MKISTITKIESANTLIIPIRKDDKLEEELLKRAKTIDYSMEELSESFSAEKKEVLIVATPKKKFNKVVFIGLGKDTNSKDIINVFRSFFKNNKKKLSGEIVIDLKGIADLAELVANGISLAAYEIGMLKTRDAEVKTVFNNDSTFSFWITSNQEAKIKESIARGLATAETQMSIMGLVDAPSNYKTPQMMADYIQKSGKKNGFKVTVYDEKACEKMGFHALLAVGRGSVDRPAKMVVMEYKSSKDAKKVGLVGKGVTFDTGGVSLKPGNGMEDMKMDMGGSAAVIGAVELAAKLKLDVNLVGIVAITENCIDALAIKPGDVINSYAGKTIEIINTDAEGRLILADAVHYMATEFEPEVMIDLATLTGSCIRTLGHVASGMMTNNDKLATQLEKAAESTGEKVWRLPLWDDFKSELDSDVADIKNLGGPYAGATTAGKFIEYFTNEHPNWAHLDIAGTAFQKDEFSKGGSATAYGVRLLTQFMEKY
ncbi:leucyl aminopeptidase family protein [Arcticibacterium luteifluviistationis]|uniref:Probable cytosol aminopeptidase n=1 Tax=Arcticibacterium luteifluviistationis TaxID=1784714 RepID=A0A2Z4GFW9_9BACT|nr:leucyl aminopeptidase [Arcticibacterium luteifluviistationis]AWV99957.1 leucyl aminopeptidase [Arcticibacterium luteifluviistationis]